MVKKYFHVEFQNLTVAAFLQVFGKLQQNGPGELHDPSDTANEVFSHEKRFQV